MVLLSTAHIQSNTLTFKPKSKFQPKYVGPFKVSKVLSDVAYKLDLPTTMKIHPLFHISLLKGYVNPVEHFPQRHIEPPPPLQIGNEVEYEVEKVLDKRTLKTRGKPIVQ